MEQEFFYSGYCLVLDGSRTVAAVTEDGRLTEVDCCFDNCAHTQSCPIAKQLQQLLDS